MTIEKHKLPVEGVWHVFFKKSAEPKSLHMILQCPGCKSQVDLGLHVQVAH